MRPKKTEVIPAIRAAVTPAPAHGLRGVVAHRVEEILGEVAPTLRKLRTLLVVVTVSISPSAETTVLAVAATRASLLIVIS